MRNAKPFQRFALGFVVLSLVALASCHAFGQPAMPTESVCAILAGDPGRGASGGTGVLLDVRKDAKGLMVGIVLTNAHVTEDHPQGPFRASFDGGKSHLATLLRQDRELDLAALYIGNVDRPAAKWTDRLDGEKFYGIGYGMDSTLDHRWGNRLSDSRMGRRRSFGIAMPTRHGDSGGPVINERGEVCGICWAGHGREYGAPGQKGHYYSCGDAIHPSCVAAFMAELGVKPSADPNAPLPSVEPIEAEPMARRYETQCPNGQCQPQGGWYSVPPQQQPPRPPQGGFFTPEPAPQPEQPKQQAPAPDCKSCDCAGKLAEITKRLDALEKQAPKEGPPGPQGPAGKDGAPGARGQEGRPGQDATVDLDALAAKVGALLAGRKLKVIQKDYYTGEVLDTGFVSLDGSGELVLRYGFKGEKTDARPQ